MPVETSESLEGIFPGGLIKHGKKGTLLKRFDSLRKLGRDVLEPDKYLV